VTPDQVVRLTEQVVAIQRDCGDRKDRSRARFKYTIDRYGLAWFCAELEKRLGFALEPARAFSFETHGDQLGWQRDAEGRWHLGLFIENGRVSRDSGLRWMDALRELASEYELRLRVTTNQNLVISDIAESQRGAIRALFARYGIEVDKLPSPLRRHALA
jgi:sulfite reductase (NADPH) hemoprotein beta-component